jgi:hypothetical protein
MNGHRFQSVPVAEPAQEVEEGGLHKFEDLTTERLQAAHDALANVGALERVIQPYKDLIE